jgi:ATPase subunit of ABC transporter with duplicated ATPase domains
MAKLVLILCISIILNNVVSFRLSQYRLQHVAFTPSTRTSKQLFALTEKGNRRSTSRPENPQDKKKESMIENPEELEQYEQWAIEEQEIAEEEQKSTFQAFAEEMETGETLPAYMLELLKKFGTQEEVTEAVPAAKLPTVVIMGRPNTGKSTLVNRIANCFKVIGTE